MAFQTARRAYATRNTGVPMANLQDDLIGDIC